MSTAKKEDGAARKFVRLVTEGPESYRKKYAGMTEKEMGEKIEREVNDKIGRANARRAVQTVEKMEQWEREDWNKPIFMRRRVNGRNVAWRVFWGTSFLLAAAAVVLSTLGIITFGINIGWLLLSILLAAMAVACTFKLFWFGVFLPVAGILNILIVNTDYLSIGPTAIGPIWITAYLLSIGFTILFHHSYKHHGRKNHRNLHVIHDPHTHFDRHNPDKHENVINRDDESEVFVDVSLSSTIKYVNTENFERALLRCNLGAVKAYFDNAKVKGDEATIELRGLMCGFELYVPRNWRVVDNVSNSMSGVSEKNAPRFADKKDEKTVYLTGSITMSGVEIIYV